MEESIESFGPEALEAFAKLIGEQFTASELARLFQRSGVANFVVDGAKWRSVLTALEQLQEQAGGAPTPVLSVLKSVCHPLSYVGNREKQDAVVASLNHILEFHGLRITETGQVLHTSERVLTVPHAKTDDELAFGKYDFHPIVLSHAREPFCRTAYYSAVFECCKALEEVIRKNVSSEKTGVALMSQVFGDDAAIRINSFRTVSERDHQKGFMYMCMGLMSAIRNPHAHETVQSWPMARQDALDLLALISFILRTLEAETANVIIANAKGAPSVARVRL